MSTSSRVRRMVSVFAVLAAHLRRTYPIRSADKRIVLIAGGRAIRRACTSSAPVPAAAEGAGGGPGRDGAGVRRRMADRSSDGARVDDNAALDNADAVLIFSDGGKGHPAIQGDRAKVLDALAAKGVGLGFAHYAVDVPAGVPGDTMQRWIGGYYETNFSVNPMWKPAFDKFPEPPGDARRRPVCNARRVVLQHAVDGGCGGHEGEDHAAPRRDAER